MPLTYTSKNGLNDNFCVLYNLSQLKKFFKKSQVHFQLVIISWDSFCDHGNVSWVPFFLRYIECFILGIGLNALYAWSQLILTNIL